jgi:hypothetical protein
MSPARQQIQTGTGLLLRLGLGQHAPPYGHHRIGGEDDGVIMRARDLLGLGGGEAEREKARRFLRKRRFVDLGGGDKIRFDADLTQKVEASRAGGGEHKAQRRYFGQLAQP